MTQNTTSREERFDKRNVDGNFFESDVADDGSGRDIYDIPKIKSFIKDEINSLLDELLSEVDGMKLREKGMLNIHYAVDKTYNIELDSDRALLYNQALDDVRAIINHKKQI
jgi:hypothetical protein